ncbi:hypothetical protein WN943_025421 [Citrus x changshan-huyou]
MWLYVVSIVSIFIISTWPVGEKKKHFQLNFPFYFHYFILFLLFITSEGTSEGSDANSPNVSAFFFSVCLLLFIYFQFLRIISVFS